MESLFSLNAEPATTTASLSSLVSGQRHDEYKKYIYCKGNNTQKKLVKLRG